ncbi:hypothetical protein MTO96_020355 [Rhipicephalus appendiculatus]
MMGSGCVDVTRRRARVLGRGVEVRVLGAGGPARRARAQVAEVRGHDEPLTIEGVEAVSIARPVTARLLDLSRGTAVPERRARTHADRTLGKQ